MKLSHLHLFGAFICLLLVSCNQAPITYYLDAENGNDSFSGKSPDKALQTLKAAGKIKLKPGDSLLLKRDSRFEGELHLSASGTANLRIGVGAYGTGNDPVISGYDTSKYAVRIYNSDWLTLQDIHIINRGKERMAGRTGLKIEAVNRGTSHHLIIDGVTIADVNGSLVKEEGGGSGILIENGGDEMISVFDSLTIRNCRILNCSRNAMIWSGYWSRENWHPSKHTLIEKNLIQGVPGDGIVPIGCDSTRIRYNVMRDCPDILPDTEAAAGIWPWSCDNTIIEYNEVSDHKAPWDAQGFDSDWNCTNTSIQYNYSHNNEGGMVLICNSGESPEPANIGNIGTVVQYNISVNDAVRTKPTRAGIFSPTIHIAGPVQQTQIRNNLIHAGPKPAGAAQKLIVSDSWGGYAENTLFAGNLFYSAHPLDVDLGWSTENHFTDNIYIGLFSHPKMEQKQRRVSPALEAQIARDFSAPNSLSFLLDTMQMAGFDCIFVNKKAIESFFEEIDKTD